MSNNIQLNKIYSQYLDEVYTQNAVTSILECDNSLVREGANANELEIPSLTLSGLADYKRNTGYVRGDVTLTRQTVQCNYQRGVEFEVDALDNEETSGIAFGKLANTFMRTQVTPEIDAVRFSAYAGKEGISTVSSTLTSGNNVITSIRNAVNTMDNNGVISEGRILFITSQIKGLVDDLDVSKSRAVFEGFEKVIIVPKSRFYTNIKLNDGISEGETGGGFVTTSSSKPIGFMIVQKDAVVQYTKHKVTKIIRPENNPDSDAWKYCFRICGVNDVLGNKLNGIYAHINASA